MKYYDDKLLTRYKSRLPWREQNLLAGLAMGILIGSLLYDCSIPQFRLTGYGSVFDFGVVLALAASAYRFLPWIWERKR